MAGRKMTFGSLANHADLFSAPATTAVTVTQPAPNHRVYTIAEARQTRKNALPSTKYFY
jgi:hypothetical protein